MVYRLNIVSKTYHKYFIDNFMFHLVEIHVVLKAISRVSLVDVCCLKTRRIIF